MFSYLVDISGNWLKHACARFGLTGGKLSYLVSTFPELSVLSVEASQLSEVSVSRKISKCVRTYCEVLNVKKTLV